MLRHALDRVHTRLVAVLVSLATVTGAAFAVAAAAQEPADPVRAAGSDVRTAEAPRVPVLVRRATLERAVERRAVRVRAAQEASGITAATEAQAHRYAEEPRSAPEEPRPAPAAPASATGSTMWDSLARCESGGNWSASAGLYEGGLQFHPSTWDRNKPAGYPDAAYQASREQQIVVAERVLASQGWSAWPACASELGLR